MKNVTITLDEATAAWARVRAAEQDVSLSRYVGELLQRQMRESREYEAAMKAYFAEKPIPLKKPGGRYLTRDEIYAWPRVR